MAKNNTRKRTAAGIPPASKARIVELSLHPDLEASAKNKARIPLALKLVGVSLLAVLAFSGFRTALKFHRARQEPQTAAAIVPSPIHVEETAAEIASVTALVENNAVRKGDQPDMGSRLESFSDAPPPYHSGTWQHVDSPWSFDLGFEELVAWLADARRLWQEATIDPYMKDALPAGFTITDLKPDAIYQKMGLQNGDIIQGVNGEAVTGPEQVAFFFQRVAEGGVVEIKIKRRRRTRYISLTIQ